jgi:hypothetical protein
MRERADIFGAQLCAYGFAPDSNGWDPPARRRMSRSGLSGTF